MMIDTITIKVHNLRSKYRPLYEQFFVSETKKSTFVDGYISVDNQEKKGSFQRVKFYSDSGKFLPVSFGSKLFVPSSDYTIYTSVKHTTFNDATLDLTFSVPKYLFGTNVFQFLAFPESSSEANFQKLLRFVRRFMQEQFHVIPANEDIQISRVDFCYNQMFPTMREALVYQGAQWEHMRNYCIGKNMRFVPQPDSDWSILTQRYSFKCYHKGKEFRKNDMGELDKAGMRKGDIRKGFKESKYDLSKLAGIADRTLRYEITFRNSMMNYLMGYNYFLACGEKPSYIQASNLRKYILRVSKNPVMAMPMMDGKLMTPKEFFCSRRKGFRLKSVFDLGFDYRCLLSPDVTFEYGVYRGMFDFFWEKVKDAQLSHRTNIPEALKKIKEYQERLKRKKEIGLTRSGSMVHKGGINFARIFVPLLLSQQMDLRELKKYLPKNTYQSLIGDFKKMGISLYNEEILIPKPAIDYEQYRIYVSPLEKKSSV